MGLREPWKFFQTLFLCICLFVQRSFLNGFQPNLYQHFSNVCSTCHICTIFSLK